MSGVLRLGRRPLPRAHLTIHRFVGSISRLDQTLTFAKRNPNLIRPELPEVDPVKKAETATENEKISAEPHSGSVFGPGLSGIYAGLVHQVSRESPVMGIQQDLDFWQSSMYDQASSKLFLVDSAESDVHQIFFDGSFLENKVESLLCREVAETDGGKPLPWAEMRDCFVHRCDVWGSVTNPNYFLDAIDRCEANFAARVERLRAADAGAGSDPLAGSGLDEGAKDYIYRKFSARCVAEFESLVDGPLHTPTCTNPDPTNASQAISFRPCFRRWTSARNCGRMTRWSF